MPIPFSTLEQIAAGLAVAFIVFLVALGRKRLRFYWIRRKIQPRLEQITQSYKEEIGEYLETFPKLVVSDRKPQEEPYGFIFITPEEIDAVEQVFLISIPPACSLRKIRLLFDANLKRAFFDYFSWRLAIGRKREDIASKILDNSLKNYPQDFKAIQKLQEENKLGAISLQEALRRLRKYKDLTKISPDDIAEYSAIVREWAERDFGLVLVGRKSPEEYVDAISHALSTHKEVLALARGDPVKRLTKASELCQQAIKPVYIKREGGEWYFVEKEDTQPVLRIWFRRTPFEDTVRLKAVG